MTVPDKRMLMLNMSAKKRSNKLPLMKNGNREDLRPLYLNKEYKQVVLSNTCAFDSLTSLLMHAIIDSVVFREKLEQLDRKSVV